MFDRETGEELAVWGPRPEPAQTMVLSAKQAGIPHDDYLRDLHTWYGRDKILPCRLSWWNCSCNSVVQHDILPQRQSQQAFSASREEENSLLFTSFFMPLVAIALMWLVKAFEHVSGYDLAVHGIFPRTLKGLQGVLFSPFYTATGSIWYPIPCPSSSWVF